VGDSPLARRSRRAYLMPLLVKVVTGITIVVIQQLF
jgi:hypothetical protein